MANTGEEMVEGNEGVVIVEKRKIVVLDALGNETVGGRQKKAKKDDNKNLEMRALIYHLHEALALLAGYTELDMLNVDSTMKLTSIIWTIYVCFKQEASGQGRVKEKINDVVEFATAKTPIIKANVWPGLKEIFRLYGIKFTVTDEDQQLRGCFQSNFALIYTFKMRCQEGVYMNMRFTISETKTKKTEIDVSQYGVQPRHYNLLSGSNFTPMCQSALLQSLGPATLLINLVRCTDQRFQSKWKEATKASLSGVAGIGSIVEILAGSGATHASIISNVLDICNFGVAKVNNKASIPFCFIRASQIDTPAFKLWTSKLREANPITKEYDFFHKLDVKNLGERVRDLDFSGKGFWMFYNSLAAFEFTMSMNSPTHKNIISQYVTLAMTGLYDSDVAVFKFMFGNDMILRKDYGDALVKRKSLGKPEKFKLVPAIRVCKFATATQSKYGLNQQLDMVPSNRMSGVAEYKMKDGDALHQSLRNRGANLYLATTNPSALEALLYKQKETIETKIGANRIVQSGTTQWFTVVAGTSSKTSYGAVCEETVQKVGQTFFSQN